MGLPHGSTVKDSAASSAGDTEDSSLIPGWGRSPWRRKWQPLQYSCLKNPLDRGAWWAYSPWDQKESDTTELAHTNESVG